MRLCSAGYGGVPLFTGVDLEIAPGEVVAVVGRSGVGKTTLLHLAAGLLSPWTGTVTLDGSVVKKGDPRVGVVQQHYGLFPWLTVWNNVSLGLKLRKVSREERYRKTAAALAEVDLLSRRDAYPGELSGGERQRVALARTRAYRPDLLLLDEPFSALDAVTREELQEAFMELQRAGGHPTLVVTHSLEEAIFLAHRIGILKEHAKGLTILENPWRMDYGSRNHRHRGEADFLHALGVMRHLFEEGIRE